MTENFDKYFNSVAEALDPKKEVDAFVDQRVSQAGDEGMLKRASQKVNPFETKKSKNNAKIRKIQQTIETDLETKVIPTLQKKADALKAYNPDSV